MEESLLSVGVDLGTSTTQIIFSRLHLKNKASGANVPRMEIVQKEILYKSDIHFTPLLSPTTIDTEKVLNILKAEYQKAGFLPADTDTGAVIITGETARKENASAVLNILSEFSGDFVVATAGADLESILSAKGAGIDALSKEHRLFIANADIGGGTTNIAVYKNGVLQNTACYDIGGRLIRYDQNRTVTYIAPKLKEIIRQENLSLKEGVPLNMTDLSKLLDLIVSALENAFGIKQSKYHDLLVTHKGLTAPDKLTHISFSGGVAEGIYNHLENPFAFGDIGVFLAEKIKNSALFPRYTLQKGTETIRATVVGAGSHAVSLSGSTVFFDPKVLPLKNLPVTILSSKTLPERTEDTMTLFSVRDVEDLSFAGLSSLADHLQKILHPALNPVVLNFEKDIGKTLGYMLKSRMPDKTILSMDSLKVSESDYVDIGKPAPGGSVLPVVIKTLLFQ
ncbi:MAG: ethanolamine ammonia-lyase reactivating factor EutA [Clostridia bacterium]|nr:ethanolamine ammonia-lyase reactivating factor EutA [Clostridia bacterium]